MESAEEYGRDVRLNVRTRRQYLGSPLPIMRHAKDVTAFCRLLVALRHILNRYLRAGPAERISIWLLLAVFVELLVRSCLGIGDPDNGGVLMSEGLAFLLGLWSQLET